MFAAELREISSGHYPEFCGERLKQHGYQIRQQHDPEERVAVLRASLDVRREVPGVHVGN